MTKEKAKNIIKQMIKHDDSMYVIDLYRNSKEYRAAREFLKLKLQNIINS